MSIYDIYKTDAAKERDQGIEMELPGGAKIWLRRAGGANTKFDSVMDAVMKPYRRQIQQGILDEGKAAELEATVYARAVVIDWAGVTDEDGNLLDCTEENIVKVFTDLPDLFLDVKQQASSMANFRRAQQEEDAKNSGSRSTTNSDTQATQRKR